MFTDLKLLRANSANIQLSDAEEAGITNTAKLTLLVTKSCENTKKKDKLSLVFNPASG